VSGAGGPTSPVGPVNARVAIIAASWHEEVMEGLVAGATRTCDEAGARWQLIRVPGSFELALGCSIAAATRRFEALISLGVIIRGDTPHFDYVCRAATDGILRVNLDSGVPIGFGLLTCDTEAQALDRAGLADSAEDKGAEAAHAALTMVTVIRALG
jgi:6,7-dimethyl-8-ribityllumazine synthase